MKYVIFVWSLKLKRFFYLPFCVYDEVMMPKFRCQFGKMLGGGAFSFKFYLLLLLFVEAGYIINILLPVLIEEAFRRPCNLKLPGRIPESIYE